MNLKDLSEEEFQKLWNQLNKQLSSLGLEVYPFKIQWYNKMVSPKFRLQFDDNCIAFIMISTPDMFENAFIPYLRNHWSQTLHSDQEWDRITTDPIDECMKYHLKRIKSRFSDLSVEVIHDFEILPNKKPKVLVQTAAHVSGAAFYYKSDLCDSDKKLGLCIHPEFGGWFAMRAVFVFKGLTSSSLTQRQPKDVLSSDQQKEELLKEFNENWKEWKYRDVIPVIKKYSDLQIKYFSLKPSERKSLIKQLMNSFQNIVL